MLDRSDRTLSVHAEARSIKTQPEGTSGPFCLGLNLIKGPVYHRLASEYSSSCLSLLSVDIVGMNHHAGPMVELLKGCLAIG